MIYNFPFLLDANNARKQQEDSHKQAIENNQTSASICSADYNKHSKSIPLYSEDVPLYFVDCNSLNIINPTNANMFCRFSQTNGSDHNTRLFCNVESGSGVEYGVGKHLTAYYKKPLFSNTEFCYITSFGKMVIYDYLEDILCILLKQNGYKITNYLNTDISFMSSPDNKKAALSFGNIKFNWDKPAE